MRIAVGLLGCLGVSVLTSALADPPTAIAPPAATGPAATAAPAPPNASSATDAAADAAAVKAAAKKAELDRDTKHFLAEGYKPRMRHGELLYCRREAALGSRVETVRCATLEALKAGSQVSQDWAKDAQRTQLNPALH